MFDLRSAAPFVNKSVSEQTRRAYGRALSTRMAQKIVKRWAV